MNAEELRAVQAPLKQRYRDTPDAARVPARAEVRSTRTTSRAPYRPGTARRRRACIPATGGSDDLACSADMLLEAVVACAGVTLRAVATALGVTVRGGRVIAEGWWDARGTLGIDRSVPVGVTDIALRFEIDSDADPTKLERMIQTTERYCVILQTLRNPPRITVG